MENDLQLTSHDFLIYKDGNNDVKVSVMLINNDLWLTQDLIAEFFKTVQNKLHYKDWVEKLNAFLQFNGKEILHNAGTISNKVAEELAYKEYNKFRIKQDRLIESDFDKFLIKVNNRKEENYE